MAGGQTTDVDGRATLEVDAKTFLGTTKDGVLIVRAEGVGDPARRQRLEEAPARKKGSAWADRPSSSTPSRSRWSR